MSKDRWARVLIVEDSPTAGRALSDGISRDPRLAVAGIATTAQEAVAMADALRPDVMTVDLMLPDDTGLRVIQRVLNKRFVPIVVVSSLQNEGADSMPFRALVEGALDVVAKPEGDPASYRRFFAELNDRLALTAFAEDGAIVRTPARKKGVLDASALPSGANIDCVVVGASTGGPSALVELLTGLGPDFSAPIVIVQHIAPPFVEGLVRWLDCETPLRVCVVNDGMQIVPGHAYVAPPEADLILTQGRRLQIRRVPPNRRHVAPSVDALFESAAEIYRSRCAGVLLSGMGRDGAAGLLKMRGNGAPTFAQNKWSSSVFGMPAAAGRLGAVGVFAEPSEIAVRLRQLVANTERVSQ